MPYRTVARTIPPEGLNHTRTQEEHGPHIEHSSTNEYTYNTVVLTPQVYARIYGAEGVNNISNKGNAVEIE